MASIFNVFPGVDGLMGLFRLVGEVFSWYSARGFENGQIEGYAVKMSEGVRTFWKPYLAASQL